MPVLPVMPISVHDPMEEFIREANSEGPQSVPEQTAGKPDTVVTDEKQKVLLSDIRAQAGPIARFQARMLGIGADQMIEDMFPLYEGELKTKSDGMDYRYSGPVNPFGGVERVADNTTRAEVVGMAAGLAVLARLGAPEDIFSFYKGELKPEPVGMTYSYNRLANHSLGAPQTQRSVVIKMLKSAISSGTHTKAEEVLFRRVLVKIENNVQMTDAEANAIRDAL